MKFFLDISIALLIVATVIVCWHRGFIRSVLGAAKTVLAVIATYLFGARASAFLAERVVGARVTSYVHSRFVAMHEQGTEVFDLSRVAENLPEWLKNILERTGVDFAGPSYEGITEANGEQLYDMAQSFAAPITKVISDLLGYALVFFIALLCLNILAFLLGKIADLPVIRGCDRLLGLALGLVCAVLYASVYAVLIYAVFSMIEGAEHAFRFHEAMEQTRLFQLVYEYNVFRVILGIG